MTVNNTTGTYVQPAFMDIPRIGGVGATTEGTMSPYASTLVGAGVRHPDRVQISIYQVM